MHDERRFQISHWPTDISLETLPGRKTRPSDDRWSSPLAPNVFCSKKLTRAPEVDIVNRFREYPERSVMCCPQ